MGTKDLYRVLEGNAFTHHSRGAQGSMPRPFLTLLVAAAVAAGCGADYTEVQLANDSGSFVLSYACTDSAPVALQRGTADLVRNIVVQESAEHILAASNPEARTPAAGAVRAAQKAGDMRALERAVAGYVCRHGAPPTRPPRFPEPGSQPPEFVLTALYPEEGDPGAARLSDLRGRAVVLVFWSTWCAACRDEYTQLQALSARAATDNVITFAILHSDTPANLRRWRQKHGAGVRFLDDAGERIAQRYGVYGIPYTVVIRPDGRVHTAGHVSPEALQRVAAEAMQQSSN